MHTAPFQYSSTVNMGTFRITVLQCTCTSVVHFLVLIAQYFCYESNSRHTIKKDFLIVTFVMPYPRLVCTAFTF